MPESRKTEDVLVTIERSFKASDGVERMRDAVDKLSKIFPVLQGNENSVAIVMSRGYCIGYVIGLEQTELECPWEGNVDVNDLASLSLFLYESMKCTGKADAVRDEENKQKFIREKQDEVIKIFYSPDFRNFYQKFTGIPYDTDFSLYKPITYDSFSTNPSTFTDTDNPSSCPCGNDTNFLTSLNDLNNCTDQSAVVNKTTIYLGSNSLFAMCPNKICEANGDKSKCASSCPIQKGCGSATQPISSLISQTVTIEPKPPLDIPVSFGVVYSYYQPAVLGKNCNRIANFTPGEPSSLDPDIMVPNQFASCMTSPCFSIPNNFTPGLLVGCACDIVTTDETWSTATNKPLPLGTIISGAPYENMTNTITAWSNNLNLTIPTNYSNCSLTYEECKEQGLDSCYCTNDPDDTSCLNNNVV